LLFCKLFYFLYFSIIAKSSRKVSLSKEFIFHEMCHCVQINYSGLIQKMHDRFKKKSDKWEHRATMYSKWAFLLNFAVLAMQMLHLLQGLFMDVFDFTLEVCRVRILRLV